MAPQVYCEGVKVILQTLVAPQVYYEGVTVELQVPTQ